MDENPNFGNFEVLTLADLCSYRQTAINEAQQIHARLDQTAATERDVFVHRSYIALGQHAVRLV